MKTYLGDGVYIMYNGYEYVLTTENGLQVTNEIIMDNVVLSNFLTWIESIRNTK